MNGERIGQSNSVALPNEKEMRDRLEVFPRVGELLGVERGVDRFFEELTKWLAGMEVNGYTLNQKLTGIASSTLGEASPLGRFIVCLHFNDIIEAITPDAEVVKQAKEVRRQYLEELRKLGKTETQELSHLGDWV